MNSDIKIVLAKREDVDSIHEIIVQRCRWFYEKNIDQWQSHYSDKFNKEYFFEQMKIHQLYVVKKKNEVIGVMLLKNEDKEYWEDDGNSYYIHHLAIKLGNNGLGEILLAFAFKKCREDCKGFLKLDCAKNNQKLNLYYKGKKFINVGAGEKGKYKYNLWQKKIE